MAAYNGDIDRYVRLKRPKMVKSELYCCVRGIHHNTMFAVWWSRQGIPRGFANATIRSAVCARFIMNNVISLVSNKALLPRFPYLIWYPSIALQSIYRELARIEPKSKPQVLRACIVGRYTALFDELVKETKPDKALLPEAAECSNPHFRDALLAREKEVDLEDLSLSHVSWKVQTARQMQFSDDNIYKSVELAAMGAWLTNEWNHEATIGTLYNGIGYDASSIALMAFMPEE